jgi:ubiquinone/menaquinone biosynthesis C-methylase UbiE
MFQNIKTQLVIGSITSLFASLSTFANSPVYVSGQAGKGEAHLYAQMKKSSTRYLAYRDLGPWLSKVRGTASLDYGSGLGFSSELLASKGFSVRGADINPDMVEQAKKSYPKLEFSLIKNDRLPFENRSFDLVFSSFVLFELSTKLKIETYVKEAQRVMKDDGYFIGITGSSHMHDPDYQSVHRGAKSGSLVKIKVNSTHLIFEDYLWFEKDYREAFQKAGLPICEVHYPVGRVGEGEPHSPWLWKDELKHSPILLILAQKNCERGI